MAGPERHVWDAAVERLRDELPESTVNTWIASARPRTLDGNTLFVSVPSALFKERIESRHRNRIQELIAQATGDRYEVVFEVDTDAAPSDDPDTALWDDDIPGPSAGEPSAATAAATRMGADGGEPPDEQPRLNPGFTFDNFVIGSSNRFACAAALAVAEMPARSWNPLFIYGDTGLGKTHLLQAIAHYVRQHYSPLTVRYVSTETFLNEFVDAIRTNTMNVFKRHYRDCNVLLVDDIQFIEGKERLQEEFFHTFDSLHSAGRQIVLTSDRAPRAISTLEERLRSRFAAGLITDIQPPDLETRLAILHKKAAVEDLRIPDPVLEYIATHITDNIRELEGALIRMAAYASFNEVPVSLAVAEHVLADLVAGPEVRQITPPMILNATAEMFGHSVEDLCGKSRSRPLVQARQIGMYVFRQLTDFSYPAIGRVFGNRDHTTVMHAVDKIQNLMREKRQVFDQVTALIHRIRIGG